MKTIDQQEQLKFKIHSAISRSNRSVSDAELSKQFDDVARVEFDAALIDLQDEGTVGRTQSPSTGEVSYFAYPPELLPYIPQHKI